MNQQKITFQVWNVGDLDSVDPAEHRLSKPKCLSLRNHPFARPEDPAVIHVLVDGEFAAQMHVLPGELSFARQRTRCFFGSDFFSEPHFRSLGVGGLVLLKALSVVKAPFVVNGVTQEALRTYKAAGLVHLGKIPRHIALLRSAPVLRRFMRTSALAALADPILSVAYKPFWKRIIDAARSFRLEEVTSFDTRLDELQNQYSPDFWFPRSSTFLNWVLRFPWFPQRERFHVRAYLLWPLQLHDGLPAGMMVLRFYRRSKSEAGGVGYPKVYFASLLDYFVRPDMDDIIPALLGHALAEARRAQCDVLEVAGSDPTLNDLCDLSLMRRAGGFDLLCKPLSLPTGRQRFPVEMPSSLEKASLTLGEADMVFH